MRLPETIEPQRSAFSYHEFMRIAVIAGEPSGDILGAALIYELRYSIGSTLEVHGVAGPKMMAAGASTAFPMEELSVMGAAAILPALPRLIRRFNALSNTLGEWHPRAVITIDSPEFTLRLQKSLKSNGCLRIHYVAPQVWAWRQARAKQISSNLDALLTLFPFEPAYFEPYDLDCAYVGHPAYDAALGASPDGFDLAHGISFEHSAICILPGSRQSEIKRHLPLMIEAAERLQKQVDRLVVLVPTLNLTRSIVENWLAASKLNYRIIDSNHWRWAAYRRARFALVGLGTATLEVALAGCPMLAIYRTDPLTHAIGSRLIRTDHLALPNILLGEAIVPEIVQTGLEPDNLFSSLYAHWQSEAGLFFQKQQFNRLRELMIPPGGGSAAKAACQAVIDRLQ